MSASLLLPESALVDSVEYVGDGGSCRVYRSNHQKYGDVAVKVAINSRPETIHQFKREYSILRSLHHPGICRMWEFGWTADRRPFILMQWLGDKHLYEHTDHQSSEARFGNLRLLLSAVKYLHDLGIVHRDLKGENVIVGADGLPSLSDLGLAADNGDGDSRCGTLEYMAPEVLDSGPATVQSDLYSVGVILYRIATGQLPFQTEDPLHMISLKRNPERIDYQSLSGVYPERLIQLINRCLSPDPQARPLSVSQVIEQMSIAGLLSRAGGEAAVSISDLLHHHLTSYNTSFVNEELHDLTRNYIIHDHWQADASGLWPTLLDHLRLRGVDISASSVHEVSFCTHGIDSQVSVKLCQALPSESPGRVIDYPELSRDSLAVILRKLFKGGIADRGIDLIFNCCSGNLSLLKITLESFEAAGVIEQRSAGKALALPLVFDFTPPQEYLQAVERMVPDLPDELAAAVELLAADPFRSGRELLLERQFLTAESLAALTQLHVLRDSDYQFKRSYLRECFYHRTSAVRRVELHRAWVSLTAESEPLTARERSERLFYHYIGAGDIAAAAGEALTLSDLLRRRNERELAREVAARAKALPGLHDHPALCLRVLMRSADLAKAAGELDRALSEYAAIVRAAARQKERELLAEAYKDLGDVFKAKGDNRRGTKALSQAMVIYRELEDELELSHCHNNMGNIHWVAGNVTEAEGDYQAALEIQRRLGVKRDVASTLSNLAAISGIRFKLDESIALYKESIELFREMNELGELARSENNLAVFHIWNDELEESAEYLREALRINKTLRAEKELLFNYENIAEVHYFLGNFKKAAEYCQAGLRLAPMSDHVHRGVYTTKLALSFLKQGDYRRAGRLLQLAARHERKVNDLMVSLELSSAFSLYSWLLCDYEDTARYLHEALGYADKLGDLKKKANLLLLLGRLQRKVSKSSMQLPDGYQQALDILHDLPLKREMLAVNLELVDFHLQADQIEQAEESFSNVQAADSFDGSRMFLPRARYLEGMLHLRRGKTHEAMAALSESVSVAASCSDHEQVWRSLAALADTYSGLGEYEDSLKCYLEAFETLKELAGGITNGQVRAGYLSDPAKVAIADAMEKLTVLTT